MSGIDIILGVIILLGAYGGYKNGLVLEVFSLLGIVLGVLGGFKLMGTAMVLLHNKFNVDQKVLPFIAFAVVFIIIVVVVNLLGKLIHVSLGKSVLGVLDFVAGSIFGLIKTTFMLSVVLWIVNSLKFELPNNWIADATLYPLVAGFAPLLTDWIGALIPSLKDVL